MPIPIDRLVRTHRKTIALVVERDGRLTVYAAILPQQPPSHRRDDLVICR